LEHGTSETRLGSAPSHRTSLAGLTPGTVLADRYRIVALLGRGGMGEVYRADDLRLGQPVALKFLPRDLEDNAFAKERLLAEVRSAHTLPSQRLPRPRRG
jgi:serine/threonine protein kinase